MARRSFFSFHYERDVTRAYVVRKCWVTQDREAAGFWDASPTEKARKEGDEAVRRLIESGLENTSVTVVLIGAETASRPWVLYEIRRSHERGNGLLGIYINGIKNFQGLTDVAGPNPFDSFWIDLGRQRKYFSQLYPTYNWYANEGYKYCGTWIEAAAVKAGR